MTHGQLVLRFAAVMEQKLEENRHKGGWEDLTARWLLKRLREETNELERALARGATPQEVAREAADVANFAAFIACNADGLGDQ